MPLGAAGFAEFGAGQMLTHLVKTVTVLKEKTKFWKSIISYARLPLLTARRYK